MKTNKPLTCPGCGTKFLTVEEEAARVGLTDEGIRKRIRLGRYPGTFRESVPGGFRHLLPVKKGHRKPEGG